MIGIKYEGRLGNCLLQYSAARIFALKHGLNIDPATNYLISKMSHDLVNLVTEGVEHKSGLLNLVDQNYTELMNCKVIPHSRYVVSVSFQYPEFLLEYKERIKETVKLEGLEKENDSLLVHMRLGDCDNSPRRLPLEYYDDAISRINFKEGYICSDTLDHPDVIFLKEKYGLKLLDLPPSAILKNAERFDNLVLSEGTFSWWLGVLSNAKRILINKRLRSHQWHGDIFVYPEWESTNFCD
jgi:hypothetical protein